MSDRIKECIESADQHVNQISGSDTHVMCVAVLASNALISEAIDRLSDAIRPADGPRINAPRVGILKPIVSAGEVVGWGKYGDVTVPLATKADTKADNDAVLGVQRDSAQIQIPTMEQPDSDMSPALLRNLIQTRDIAIGRIGKIKDARIGELSDALVDRNRKIAELKRAGIVRDDHIGDLTSALSAEREFSKNVQDRAKIVAMERDVANSELASTKKRLADLELNYARESDERRYVNAELAHAEELIYEFRKWRNSSGALVGIR